jgi:hypothetical protein
VYRQSEKSVQYIEYTGDWQTGGQEEGREGYFRKKQEAEEKCKN